MFKNDTYIQGLTSVFGKLSILEVCLCMCKEGKENPQNLAGDLKLNLVLDIIRSVLKPNIPYIHFTILCCFILGFHIKPQ